MNASPSRPNILFVLSDQERWDTLGCYGQSLNVTPHLDRMAAEGVRLDHRNNKKTILVIRKVATQYFP